MVVGERLDDAKCSMKGRKRSPTPPTAATNEAAARLPRPGLAARATSSTVTGQPSNTPAIRPASDPVDTLRFMFGVGIECSCPKIDGGVRVDELRDTGHYDLWQTDLKLVRELGLKSQ